MGLFVFNLKYLKNLIDYIYYQLKAPPYSPDLNPIEWVWADLKKFIRKCRCTSEEEVFQALDEFQNKLTVEYCQNYVNKLHEVIQIVIKKKGGWSNY